MLSFDKKRFFKTVLKNRKRKGLLKFITAKMVTSVGYWEDEEISWRWRWKLRKEKRCRRSVVGLIIYSQEFHRESIEKTLERELSKHKNSSKLKDRCGQ